MKTKKEFTFSAYDDGSPNIVITGLTVKSILRYITYLVHFLYSHFMRDDPEVAKAFRTFLVRHILDDRSPIWKINDPISGATEEEAHEEES